MRRPVGGTWSLLLGVAVVLAGCEAPVLPGPTATSQPTRPTPSAQPSSGPTPGGTIHLLMDGNNWIDVDPQRIVTREDQAFFGSTIYRSLEWYTYSADGVAGTTLTPDLATDLGIALDGGRTWSFTLRDGITWEDGSPVTCADVAYGVSREFATDLMGGGPTYAIRYLDIPTNADGSSQYPGPYKATARQQALFDRAVRCDGSTITFHLAMAVGDFNAATSLGMSPVPNPKDHPGVDIGEGYGIVKPPFSSGPYRVASYQPGKGGQMVLVRNESWNAASDPIRSAYPDRWEVDFGIDPTDIDHRLLDPHGADAFAIPYTPVQPGDQATVFQDAGTPKATYAGRAISGLDGSTRFLWIDTTKVPNRGLRQAIGVALDREALRAAYGGSFAGDLADGVVNPSIGQDYASTGIWDTFYGQVVAPDGDPALARRLIASSGATDLRLDFGFPNTPIGRAGADVVVSSLARAGIVLTLSPECGAGWYCKVVFDPSDTADFGVGGWAAGWPNASTVIPPLFTTGGGSDLAKVQDPGFDVVVQDAIGTLDRADQAATWQALNRQVVENGWAIPIFFGRSQQLAGTKVGPIYRWPVYASWPYGAMSVTP